MDTNIQKLWAFVKTVEYGSFTKAAEMLQYSQPGISRMIKDIESEWDVVLLERSRGGIRLTSEGMKLYPYAKAVCMEFNKLQMQVEHVHGLQTGLIRIGTIPSLGTLWLPNIIKAFQRDFPGVDYELLLGDYSEIEEWIHNGRVDCGFLRLPTALNLESIFLERDRYMAIIPRNHSLANAERFPIAELCKEPFMLQKKEGNDETSIIFERNGLVPDVRFVTWDDYSIMSMVESGLGVSILPELILQKTNFQIVAKELDVPAYRELGVAFKDRKELSVAASCFLNYLDYRHPFSV